MYISNRTKRAVVTASLLVAVGSSALFGTEVADSNSDVAAELKALKARVAELEKEENSNWMTQERTNQIRAIVEETIADAKKQGQFADADNFGYNNGFYIQTSDKKFKLNINGYTQFRYTFASDQVEVPFFKNMPDTSTSKPKSGDVDGFDFRYARLYFSGNAFTPNLTYMIMGDFAGNTNANNFQLVDNYIAYRFNDTLNVRAGSYLVPYSRLEYISSGLAFVDFPAILSPFDPKRSFGVSLYGEPVKDKLTYEVMINNGPQANHNGSAAQLGGSTDNRIGAASRVQLFGGTGKPADFADESDLRKDKSTLAWMLAGAVGYDSVNQSTNAFPGAQAGAGTFVGTNNSPGFENFKINGDLYRATVDGEIKYCGLEFTSAAFFEQINENPGAGVSNPGFANKSSFFQVSYYGQIGYMFTPKWEVVGRAGEFFTEAGPNQMDEFSLGLNYFMFGKNVKLQGDVTFIPNEAAMSDATFGTVQNTQDVVTRLQLQLKF
jgi:hypothetical protein